MVLNLTLEDFEDEDGEFDITEAPDFLTGAELDRFKAKYSVKVTFDNSGESCGDDGICRSFPGASFYYD